MYNRRRCLSAIPWLASALMLLAFSCTGRPNATEGITTSEMGFLVFTGIFSIVVLILALTLFLTLLGSVIYFVFRSPRTIVSESGTGHTAWNIGLIAASIALFGILISGVFVFMTLQINTTAERTAEQTAHTIAAPILEREAAKHMNALEPGIRELARDLAREVAADEVRKLPFAGLEILADTLTGPPVPDTESCSSTVYRSPSQQPGDDETRVDCAALDYTNPIRLDHEHTVTLGVSASERVCVDLPHEAGGSLRTPYRIAVDAVDGFDPIVSLYRSTGALLHIDDDGGEGLDSCFEIDLGAGAYILEVREVSSRGGHYVVTVQEVNRN